MNLLQGKWPRLATLLAVLVAAALVFLAWERYTRTPWTRDARVRADVVTLSADVSGLITRLPLSDNQPVEKGELLLSIDPARYELAVLRAERAVNVARAALGESRAAIEASQAQLRQRRSEAQRRSALQKRSMLSVEENEKAQTDVSLAQAELLRNQASLGLAQANVELAEAALQQARLDLERTQVRAPVSGYVTNLQTREGDYAHAGVPLLALVDRDSFYVSGYFEETKLPGIHVGSRARVELMSGERFDGRVQSICPCHHRPGECRGLAPAGEHQPELYLGQAGPANSGAHRHRSRLSPAQHLARRRDRDHPGAARGGHRESRFRGARDCLAALSQAEPVSLCRSWLRVVRGRFPPGAGSIARQPGCRSAGGIAWPPRGRAGRPHRRWPGHGCRESTGRGP